MRSNYNKYGYSGEESFVRCAVFPAAENIPVQLVREAGKSGQGFAQQSRAVSRSYAVSHRNPSGVYVCENVCFLYRMTKFDIRNYFEKIYGVNVAKVNTRIQLGKV